MTAPETSTRQERAQAIRRRMLEAAVELFTTRPFNEVSAAEIGARAGTAHGLLFHHFGSKRGLYLEAVREISRRLFDVSPSDPTAPPGRQLRDLLRQHFARVAEHEDLLLGYVSGSIAMTADPEAWDVLEELRLRTMHWLCDLTGLDPASP